MYYWNIQGSTRPLWRHYSNCVDSIDSNLCFQTIGTYSNESWYANWFRKLNYYTGEALVPATFGCSNFVVLIRPHDHITKSKCMMILLANHDDHMTWCGDPCWSHDMMWRNMLVSNDLSCVITKEAKIV